MERGEWEREKEKSWLPEFKLEMTEKKKILEWSSLSNVN